VFCINFEAIFLKKTYKIGLIWLADMCKIGKIMYGRIGAKSELETRVELSCKR
jgi:hypothetical protein